MNADIRTAVCVKHERVLKESHQALVKLNEHLAGVLTIGVKGRERDNEFRKRQANYAKAYKTLQNHARNCQLCSFDSGVSVRSAAQAPANASANQRMLRHRERCEGFRYCLERIQELCKLLRLRRLLCQQTTRRWPGGDKALTTILFTVQRVAASNCLYVELR
jgi:hypothetical protein